MGSRAHTGSDGLTPPQADRRRPDIPIRPAPTAIVYSYADSVDQAMEAFLLDWGFSDAGHRTNIMEPNVSAQDAFRDVGHRPSCQQQRGRPTRPARSSSPRTSAPSPTSRPRSSAWPITTSRAPASISPARVSATSRSRPSISRPARSARLRHGTSAAAELPAGTGHHQLIASQNNQVISSQSDQHQ